MPQDEAPRSPRAPGSRWFTAGCVLSVLTGLAHMMTRFVTPPPPVNEQEATLRELLTGFVLPEIGRSTEELLDGFSWWFTLGLALPALTSVLVRFGRASDRSLLQRLGIGHITLLSLGLAVSLRYFFFVPTTLIGAALTAFVIATVRATTGPGPQESARGS